MGAPAPPSPVQPRVWRKQPADNVIRQPLRVSRAFQRSSPSVLGGDGRRPLKRTRTPRFPLVGGDPSFLAADFLAGGCLPRAG